MSRRFSASENYQKSRKAVGYVARKKASQETYDRLGFKSGLEVHQQLLTSRKLFCKCPAGIFQKADEYDAEVIRHMRPTLSELGEYDGTALMEFKTRKKIVYHLANETACTYEVDDTPPFPIDREALEISLKISLLSKLNIVGEVHITRKQYLDGSIPTGFQRTAIIGVEGEIELPHKKIRLIQLSLEEDSCREISDIGHTRVYRTDRLGMPLIETVTYPDCVNPDEVRETCDYIRFLNRSTGLVRTGIGAGRQDVNVSCRGGSRVEIKGVAHTKWIPELTHNEVFRQWALLKVRDLLNQIIPDTNDWEMDSKEVTLINNPEDGYVRDLLKQGEKVYAINLPKFRGILSHFTQPGHCFANEIEGRLNVIACLEAPFMLHSEMLDENKSLDFDVVKDFLNADPDDAQILIWGDEEDMPTALETIEERCRMAFDGVPLETRKSFADGSTVFERVLPGADRMYPDTDSAPIPLKNDYIDALAKQVPTEIIERYHQMKKWNIPEDTFTYIFSKNYFPLLEKLILDLGLEPVYAGKFIGQELKFIEGHYSAGDAFDANQIVSMFQYLAKKKYQPELAKYMLPMLYEHPKMDFDSILLSLNFKEIKEDDIVSLIPFLKDKFKETAMNYSSENEANWMMGELRKKAVGNMELKKLYNTIKN